MTRFIYITDTHIGPDQPRFYQQPAYPERAGAHLKALQREAERLAVDFIVHGGDLVHGCSPESIRHAAQLLDFSVPVYLCLGNHDLDRPDALSLWLGNAPDLFGGSPDFSIESGSCVVHIVPNHWEEGKPYYWDKVLQPYFSDDQLAKLKRNIEASPHKQHVLVTHSPVFGMSMEQSGLPEVIHDPPESFRGMMLQLTRQYPNLRAVLSGHNHLNTLTQTSSAVFASGSAFVETPFEYKLVELTDQSLSLSTHSIKLEEDGFIPHYNEEKAYVQGRQQDRGIHVVFS